MVLGVRFSLIHLLQHNEGVFVFDIGDDCLAFAQGLDDFTTVNHGQLHPLATQVFQDHIAAAHRKMTVLVLG